MIFRAVFWVVLHGSTTQKTALNIRRYTVSHILKYGVRMLMFIITIIILLVMVGAMMMLPIMIYNKEDKISFHTHLYTSNLYYNFVWAPYNLTSYYRY
jgi:hypothetical protein